MQLNMGSAVVSTALVGVPPTSRSHSPWRTKRRVESAIPTVRRDAEQSDRDSRAPLFPTASFRLGMAVLLYPGGRTAILDPAAHQTAPDRFDRFGVSVENDDPGAGRNLGDGEVTPRDRSETMLLETPAPFLGPKRERLNGRAHKVLVEHAAGSNRLRITLEFLQDLRMGARLEAINRGVSPRRAVIAPFA